MFSIDLIKQKIATEVSDLLGVSVDEAWVEHSNPKAGSHLALPCFRFANQAGASPVEVASRVAQTLSIDDIDRIEAQGPYLNFWLSANALAEGVREAKETALKNAPENNKIAIVDFLSPNLAKPLSIGHFRNALQGRAIVRMYLNAGYEVITDDHIGDWGTVFGMWVVGFEKFSSDEKLATGGVEELGRMYIKVREALGGEEDKEDKPLTDEIQSWLIKLENKDPVAWEYHQRFSQISIDSIKEQMAELGIEFDYHYGESFYVERGKEMVQEMLASGAATQNEDGSIIVDLAEQGVDTPMLVQKSNGAALYHTSDIATIDFREKTWNPDTVLYVVGMEQQFHFKQLFAANQKVGWSDAELVHHWYGLIEELGEDGKRRKMSSRKSAIYMKDLLALAVDKARAIAKDDMSEDDLKKIAYGALTFQEFSGSHKGNTLFDWEAMFSLSGFSGPYVQYAAVRINSVLNKTEEQVSAPPSGYNWSPYGDLLWQLNKYEGVIDDAMAEREFHKLAEYAYELAKAWNKFYDDNPILQADGDDRVARLWLAQTIGAYLERSLYLIGISVPSKM